ncbi:hypothetical protein ABZW03_04935 [Kitasatospora sp. NPDC004799]|uniref:hypothetical protein n=1 Tax=Kitasatospora sp. NPDC004799 TaxID=3154460 RepID=UPI0033A5B790
MMPTETIAPQAEQARSSTGDPATAVATRQESAPVGPAGKKGFHIFTITLGVEPRDGEYKPGTLTYKLTAPSGWKWVDWGNYYYYDEENYKHTQVKTLQTSVDGKVLSFSLDSHLNTGKSDGTRLCFTVMADPESKATKGMSSDGKVAVTGSASKLPADIKLYGIIT